MYLSLIPLDDTLIEYKELLNKYHIVSEDYAEVDEIIASDEKCQYRVQVFILSSDFGIIIIFPEMVKGTV